MEPKDNFENIALPHVRTVKLTLLRDEIESISDEEMGRRITCMKRKLDDVIVRDNFGGNKKIHGINEKEE